MMSTLPLHVEFLVWLGSCVSVLLLKDARSLVDKETARRAPARPQLVGRK